MTSIDPCWDRECPSAGAVHRHATSGFTEWAVTGTGRWSSDFQKPRIYWTRQDAESA